MSKIFGIEILEFNTLPNGQSWSVEIIDFKAKFFIEIIEFNVYERGNYRNHLKSKGNLHTFSYETLLLVQMNVIE